MWVKGLDLEGEILIYVSDNIVEFIIVELNKDSVIVVCLIFNILK